ncbi:3-dehydroquinate dehydratase II [Gracilibacillus boraciitolerans JCM 21714]|uniref:3-dehydroquinate dehydratase n=1 Tax=Gracilibacillus boraciitolerans JCM 21714 TaxID=1298598 RepID=W4VDH1_9BACI|nr:type II 3-dehydroquinate dehydratase [Gracilibacillus boraciitolerans]GAE91231.1 3-dehydroquinate dehydratase II [Gracilibacillus boraciitolerans JCM 21714]
MGGKLLLLNGPNLNRLGKREPGIYGSKTLSDVEKELSAAVEPFEYQIDAKQSNHEGQLIDWIQESEGSYDGIIFNPGGYTHTSVAIRDAISSVTVPVIEVHISNVHQREAFRHTSMLAPVCEGQIVGLGTKGYFLAAKYFIEN